MTVRDLYEIAEVTGKLEDDLIVAYEEDKDIKNYPVNSVKFEEGKIIVEVVE